MNINHNIPKFQYSSDFSKPTFRSEYEKEKFWDVEKTRWREGHSGLSGMHYFYLTQCTIKDGSSGNPIRPFYRDCDEWIIDKLHKNFWSCEKTIGLVKRRELGATSLGAGLLSMYSMRMFTGSTFGMTSCDQPRISKAFSDKTIVCLDELDLDIKPSIERIRNTANSSHLKLGWKTKRDGKAVIQYSDLFAKETSDSNDSAKGFSSTRMRAAYFDEYPLHKRKKLLLTSSLPCFMKGAERSGFLFWGGTVEHDITNEEISELHEIVNDASLLDTEIIFAPAWWGLMLKKDGTSDEKAGIEWVMKERERYDKLENKSDLRAFIKNYPLTLDEIFELGSGGAFEDDVAEKIKLQITTLKNNPPPIMKCKLVALGNSIQTAPSTSPNMFIYKHPKPNVSYYQLIDGTATGKKTGDEDGSNVCGIIFRGYDPSDGGYSVDGIYYERPINVEQSYFNLINQANYYNQYGGLVKICAEGNNTSDHFSTFLEKESMGKYIQYRKDLSGKGNSNKKKPFQYVTVDVMDFQYRFLNIHLRKYISNIQMIMLLEDLLKPKDKNADMRSALLMLGVALPQDYDKPIVKKVILPEKRRRIVNKNGYNVVEWV